MVWTSSKCHSEKLSGKHLPSEETLYLEMVCYKPPKIHLLQNQQFIKCINEILEQLSTLEVT